MKQLWLLALLLPLWACSGSSSSPSPPPPPPTNSALQLKASANHRYLVDQNNAPVLLAGDSPHTMFANLNNADLAAYLANRQSHSFNILWVEGLCSDYISNCRSDLSTYDGIRPFSSGTDRTNFDVSTPNPAYWSRVDSYVNTAASYGIIILFDTWETGILMPLARANGNTKMHNFGVFLGNRYKTFSNIIWITGNDFQTWTDPTDNALMQNLMAGIASADPNHLQTTELSYSVSGSLDDALLVPYTTLAGAYDYYCAYAESLDQYNYPSPVPVFFEEGYYEYHGTTHNLRTQAWWVALAGATAGQMYGSENVYPFLPGWQSYLDTVGVTQFGYLNSLLKSIKGYNLVPDQNHTVVTAGYGTFDNGQDGNCINSNDYVATSYLSDGTAAVSYLPQSTTVTVDMSKFNAAVTARWYDPAAGSFTAISGSPFANSGAQDFSSPGSNADGDPDWVLVLTTS
ncbi:MAG TPA: DUF4038 domain-containing protein [Terriglobales bacterium]|jgi:hypothetical protein|nr:DUF4038 domain-containing protein [Terriglobales bacterium]